MNEWMNDCMNEWIIVVNVLAKSGMVNNRFLTKRRYQDCIGYYITILTEYS